MTHVTTVRATELLFGMKVKGQTPCIIHIYELNLLDTLFSTFEISFFLLLSCSISSLSMIVHPKSLNSKTRNSNHETAKKCPH